MRKKEKKWGLLLKNENQSTPQQNKKKIAQTKEINQEVSLNTHKCDEFSPGCDFLVNPEFELF